jgi:hypothetical protein
MTYEINKTLRMWKGLEYDLEILLDYAEFCRFWMSYNWFLSEETEMIYNHKLHTQFIVQQLIFESIPT